MKRFMHDVRMVSLLVLILGFGLLSGVVLDRQVLNAAAMGNTSTTPTGIDYSLIQEAWNTIDKVYVDRQAVKPTQLTYGAISGMVDALGDTGHSRFMSPEMVKAENNFTQGQFEGIGAEVEMKDGNVVIVAPIDGTPAQKAGLRPGDVIEKVNGKDVTGLSLNDVVSQILGPAGTKVTITIYTPSTGVSRDVTLQRAKITLHNVTWQQIPGTTIADVRISAFSQGVTNDLKKALTEIQAQHMTGIVLDLRNDPGGLLDEAVGVASQFLDSGNVLLEKDASGKITDVPVKSGGLATKTPMVVLINQGTASAAEIVAGALQDANRATLIGETTFGTGTVLNEFKLSDGSALLLATQEWLTPAGRVIWHKGITPDTAVTLPANVIPLTPDAMKSMTAKDIQSSGDQQLQKAVDDLNQTGAQSSLDLSGKTAYQYPIVLSLKQ
jgi:carboxyl-terminal processing protease